MFWKPFWISNPARTLMLKPGALPSSNLPTMHSARFTSYEIERLRIS